MVTTFETVKTFHSTVHRLMQTYYSATKQVSMLSYSLDIRVLVRLTFNICHAILAV